MALTDADRQFVEACSATTRAGTPIAAYDRGQLEAIRLRADGADLRRIEALLDPGTAPAPPVTGEDPGAYERGRQLAEEWNGINVSTTSVTF